MWKLLPLSATNNLCPFFERSGHRTSKSCDVQFHFVSAWNLSPLLTFANTSQGAELSPTHWWYILDKATRPNYKRCLKEVLRVQPTSVALLNRDRRSRSSCDNIRPNFQWQIGKSPEIARALSDFYWQFPDWIWPGHAREGGGGCYYQSSFFESMYVQVIFCSLRNCWENSEKCDKSPYSLYCVLNDPA